MATRAVQKAFSIITPEDHNALHGIYRHRCLNDWQLAEYFYKDLDDGKNDYTLMRINALVENWLIDAHEYKPGTWVYFLTKRGVQYIRETSGRIMYSLKERSGKKQYEASAGSLRMKDQILDHQCRLNDLVLEIIRACGLAPNCYKDNLFAANFCYAQPDGVLELPNFHIFLEMDMGNEESKILREKWTHYRNYFRSRDYQLYRKKRVIVLFATENVKKLAARRKIVLRSLSETSMDLLGPMFECYIGSNEEMIDIARELIHSQSWHGNAFTVLLQQLGAAIVTPSPEFVQTGEKLYQLSNGQFILSIDGYKRPITLLKRIAYWGQSKAQLVKTPYANLRMLVLVPSENEICRDLFHAGLVKDLDTSIGFVTMDRLHEHPLYKAVFLFDQLGNQYHFTGPEMQELCYEKRQYRPYEKKKRRG